MDITAQMAADFLIKPHRFAPVVQLV